MEMSYKPEVVNINTADMNELMRLKGVGKVAAESIISYRREHGRFSSPDEIKNVKGIGDKTFEKIKSHIIIE